MIKPYELTLELPIKTYSGSSTTTKVWQVLAAAKNGDLVQLKHFTEEDSDLLYVLYNYTPPIHFAVREGHTDMVDYLIQKNAYDPAYRSYPFQDSLITIAIDRGFNDIAEQLQELEKNGYSFKYPFENGVIDYRRNSIETEFEGAVNNSDLKKTELLLKKYPDLIINETFFWGEGIMMMPANRGDMDLLQLLITSGATVPRILKWAQFYYFKHYNVAGFLMENSMNSSVMSWHHVTLLHDMAQKGDISKAELLLSHGADVNALEEEYHSTPLGLATRWGQLEMVEYLLTQNADPNKSGAPWSTPIQWARKKHYTEIEERLLNAGAEN